MIIKIILIVLMFAAVMYLILNIQRRRRAVRGNVIRMSVHRAKPVRRREQRCSLCTQKSSRITYYADELGKPVGVCNVCKASAERRGLLPL